MNYFPQLTASSLCQFPVTRERAYRNITNTMEDGSRIVLTDPAASQVRWNLTYSGLTDAESATLKSFFEMSEGRLNSFTFADPAANLLVWSEDFTQAVWQRNTLLQANGNRLSNGTAGSLTLVQTVPVPGVWTCCWSVSLRSDVPCLVTLTRDAISLPVVIKSAWQRFQLSTSQTSTSAASDFGLLIPPGASIETSGPQVQAQAHASSYTPTLDNGGVYPATRFDSDVLEIISDAPNSNRCNLSLMSYTQ